MIQPMAWVATMVYTEMKTRYTMEFFHQRIVGGIRATQMRSSTPWMRSILSRKVFWFVLMGPLGYQGCSHAVGEGFSRVRVLWVERLTGLELQGRRNPPPSPVPDWGGMWIS